MMSVHYVVQGHHRGVGSVSDQRGSALVSQREKLCPSQSQITSPLTNSTENGQGTFKTFKNKNHTSITGIETVKTVSLICQGDDSRKCECVSRSWKLYGHTQLLHVMVPS